MSDEPVVKMIPEQGRCPHGVPLYQVCELGCKQVTVNVYDAEGLCDSFEKMLPPTMCRHNRLPNQCTVVGCVNSLEYANRVKSEPREAVVRAKHSHYYKDVEKLQFIDVYRVLQLFAVGDPCIQHAVKKLLVAGGRGAGKDISRDVQEAIDTMKRWQEMRSEES